MTQYGIPTAGSHYRPYATGMIRFSPPATSTRILPQETFCYPEYSVGYGGPCAYPPPGLKDEDHSFSLQGFSLNGKTMFVAVVMVLFCNVLHFYYLRWLLVSVCELVLC